MAIIKEVTENESIKRAPCQRR